MVTVSMDFVLWLTLFYYAAWAVLEGLWAYLLYKIYTLLKRRVRAGGFPQ